MSTKRWREFEELVARLEAQLAPAFKVVSPYPMRDRSSGQVRKVDAVVLARDGTVLIVIECRARKKPAGSPWIDELVGRRRALGAPAVIAVSRSGFTKPARTKAAEEGIDIRTIEELSEEDLRVWMPKVSVQGFAGELVRGRVELQVYPRDDADPSSIKDTLPTIDWAEPLFETAEGERQSLNDLYAKGIQKLHGELPGAESYPAGFIIFVFYLWNLTLPEPQGCRATYEFAPGLLRLILGDERWDVAKLVLAAAVRRDLVQPTEQSSFAYSDGKKTLLGVHQTSVQFDDENKTRLGTNVYVPPPDSASSSSDDKNG